MNRFYNLPDELQDMIHYEAHKLKLKSTFPFIVTKPNHYSSFIYRSFCEASYNQTDLNNFNAFLDYIHGNVYGLPWETLRENKYMMMMDLLFTYTENEDI